MNEAASKGEEKERFYFIYSCDLDEFVSIKICSLEGKKPKRSFNQILADPNLKYDHVTGSEDKADNSSHMFVTVQLYEGGKPITLPVQTKYKHYKQPNTNQNVSAPIQILHSWNEWLKLPLRYSDLPRDVLAVITIWDIHGPCEKTPVGGTTIPLFGKWATFRKNRRDLVVWPDRAGDGSVNTQTPFKLPAHLANPEITKLAKLVKKHREGPMPTVDWLDRLAFTEIEATNVREKNKQDYMYLSVEFETMFHTQTEYTLVYFERHGEVPTSKEKHKEDIIQVSDYELSEANLIEEKHYKLTRSAHSKQNLKPNATTRDRLMSILNYPISRSLISEEQDLVWKFRDYLKKYKKGLVKFLRVIKWDRINERTIALQLLEEWTPIDVADALQLLSPEFEVSAVRQYAVRILDKSTDDELVLYLLQLVQALKYEDFDEINEDFGTGNWSTKGPNFDFSYLMKSSNEPQQDANLTESDPSEMSASTSTVTPRKKPENLAKFLIRRACENLKLANYFFWYMLVEANGGLEKGKSRDKDTVYRMYTCVLRTFSYRLMNGTKQTKERRKLLLKQQKFVNKLASLLQTIQHDSSNRKKKIEKLQCYLRSGPYTVDVNAAFGQTSDEHDNTPTDNFNFADFSPIPLPLNPDVEVCGIDPETASLFKSNLMPARLTLRTTEEGVNYTVMFKEGDDLRQDQLVLQIIQLMDNLLREENLDLKLSPYRVLATSPKSGFVQIVESISIAEVLNNDGSIQNFMRKHHPNENDPYGIDRDVMDAYVKSCAGYCVITYLLGVGDRHLDNLMLIRNGALFHVDFGYILGRDPKPLPPPMKLTKEMVDAMGGAEGDHFAEFRKYCFTAFLHLRRHANLILNLFSLMVDAEIPDIALEPDKAVKKVQEKFLLEMNDEEAVRQMTLLIDESVRAVFAVVVDQIHKIAQNWRK